MRTVCPRQTEAAFKCTQSPPSFDRNTTYCLSSIRPIVDAHSTERRPSVQRLRSESAAPVALQPEPWCPCCGGCRILDTRARASGSGNHHAIYPLTSLPPRNGLDGCTNSNAACASPFDIDDRSGRNRCWGNYAGTRLSARGSTAPGASLSRMPWVL